MSNTKQPGFKSFNFLFTNYKDIIISNEHLAKVSPPFGLDCLPLRRGCRRKEASKETSSKEERNQKIQQQEKI